MLSLRDLEKHLYKEVKSFLKPKGFKKKGDELIKTSAEYINSLGISIAYYATAGSSLNFSVTVSFNAVNEILSQFYQSIHGFSGDDDYPLLIGGLTDLKNIKGNYHQDVITLEDADEALENFYIDFEKYIEPFFEQYSSLENIERYINRDYQVQDNLNVMHKSQMGVLLAHMTGREDVSKIYEEYVKSWKNDPCDEDLIQDNLETLEKLKDHLGIV